MRNSTVLMFLLWLVSNLSFGQVFVPVDADTFEIVEDVNYALYNNKQVVYKGITVPDKLTVIKEDVAFDSISLSRIDYQTLGLVKSRIDSMVLLSKKIIYLDEVVIGAKDEKEIIIGETNRFIKRHARTLSKDLDYGLVFSNGSPQKLKLNKVAFYVNKVKLKTAYRINFCEVSEIPINEGHQRMEPGEVIYATDTLYLNPKDKNKVEVVLPAEFYLAATKKMFVWIQLLGYYDAAGKEIVPEADKLTRLKFQVSDKTNYYSRMYDSTLKQPTLDIINRNLMLNYDFATLFFTTPHKSELVAPAIVLYAHKVALKPLGGSKM